MHFAFSEEQELFRDTFRNMLARECPAELVRTRFESEVSPSRDLWKKVADLGILGVTVPEAYGGLGQSELDLVLLLEESGRSALPEPLVETVAVAAPLLSELPDSALSEKWLNGIAEGSAIVTVGLARLPYFADVDRSDLLLLQREDEVHAVPPHQVTWERQNSVDGARRLFKVKWNPRQETLVASGAAARRISETAFDRGALAVSAQLLGLTRQMIDKTVEYVKVRHQFGKPIGSFQAVKHHLTDALLKLEFARPLVYRAAYSLTYKADERKEHVSMAKIYAADAAAFSARVALQCHGAIGYSFEYDLHLWMKRAWSLSSAWGDPAWHRARVGAAIFENGGQSWQKHSSSTRSVPRLENEVVA